MKKISLLLVVFYTAFAFGQTPNFSLTSISAPSVTQYDCYSVTATMHNNGAAGTYDFECDLDNSSGATWYRYIEKKCSNTVASGGNVTLTFSTSSTSANANHSVITQAPGSYGIQIAAMYSSCFSCGNTGCPTQYVGGLTPITVQASTCTGYCMSNTAVTTCNGTFYDAGGTSNYGNSQSFTKTFSPDVSGNKLRFVFSSFGTENNYDGLLIYNGPSTAYPLISSGLAAGANSTTCPAGSFYGTVSPGTINSTDASGALTFKFASDVSNNCYATSCSCYPTFSGWQASISCVSSCISITNFNLTSQTVTVTAPSSANFSVTPTGTTPSYQWQYSINGGSSWSNVPNSSPYTGITTSTLAINPSSASMNGYMYRCYLSNSCSSGYTNWGTLNVASCTPPSNPSNPASNSPQIGSVTITRSGTPPSGVIWYWQGTSCGTSTSLGSGTTYTASTSGTYYIRAYNSSTNCWSSGCGSVAVTVNTACTPPSNPANPTSNSPQIGSVTITRSGTPPSGVTWYWQGTSCGTSTSLGSGTTYTATSTGTYYIKAYNSATNCWSSACGSVTVTVNTACTPPSNPANPTSNSPQIGSVTITRSGTPPSGVVWYWQGTSCGTSTSLGSGTTYTATSSGTYYLRAYNSSTNCWSSGCGSVTVTVNSAPPSWIGIYANDLQHSYLGPKILLASADILQSFPTSANICADGSQVTEVRYVNHDASILNSNIRFKIVSDLTGVDPIGSGSFPSVSAYRYSVDTIIVTFTHPKYVIPNYFNLFRSDNIAFYNNATNTEIARYPIKIFRAPIVFVHGLWSNDHTFDDMKNDFILISSVMYSVNYQYTNGSSFLTNRNVVRNGIDQVLTQARTDGFSAGKVIIIAHSMGGILSRLYLQNTGWGIPYKNDIIKLITLNTPHYGTQIANWLWNGNQTLIDVLQGLNGLTNNGDKTAVQNMQVNSFETLNQLDISQATQSNKVASCTMTTDATGDNSFTPSAIRAVLPSTFASTIFNYDANDLIVPYTSQNCNLYLTNTITGQWHGSTSNTVIINNCKVLLDENPATSPYFTNGGFPRTILSPPAITSPNIHNMTQRTAGDSIKILSPLSGQQFNAGDSVTVDLYSSGNISRISLIVSGISINPISIDTSQAVATLQFQIPTTAIGALNLWVLGGDTTNWYAHDNTHIVVNSTSAHDSIVVNPRTIHLPIGMTNSVNVYGYFGGNPTNLIGVQGLSIIYDTTYLNYYNGGFFQGKTAGLTDVIFSYSGLSDTVHFDIYNDPSALVASFNYSANHVCANSPIQFADASIGISVSYAWSFPGGNPSFSTQANPTVMYSTSGSYAISLKVNFTNGVDSVLVDSLIYINPLPAAIITANGATTFCQGNSVILTTPTADNYLWSDGTTTQSNTILNTGIYSVSVTDSNNCSSSSAPTIVIVNALPDSATITQNGNALISNTASGNQWYDDNGMIGGETSQTFNPLTSGNYYVIVTDANGCVSQQSNVLNFAFTGIDGLDMFSHLTVTPNPSIGNFTISFETNKPEQIQIKIFDAIGQLIKEEIPVKVAGTYTKEINLGNVAKGIYILQLKSGNQILNKRIEVQ